MATEKLDSFRKIILATGAINYMAANIHSVNQQSKTIPDEKGIFKESINDRDSILAWASGKLSEIMEQLGELMNGHDFVLPIDVRATKAAFDIVVHRKDNVEK